VPPLLPSALVRRVELAHGRTPNISARPPPLYAPQRVCNTDRREESAPYDMLTKNEERTTAAHGLTVWEAARGGLQTLLSAPLHPFWRLSELRPAVCSATNTVRTFKNSLMPNSPSSRPTPLSFTPPNGSSGGEDVG